MKFQDSTGLSERSSISKYRNIQIFRMQSRPFDVLPGGHSHRLAITFGYLPGSPAARALANHSGQLVPSGRMLEFRFISRTIQIFWFLKNLEIKLDRPTRRVPFIIR